MPYISRYGSEIPSISSGAGTRLQSGAGLSSRWAVAGAALPLAIEPPDRPGGPSGDDRVDYTNFIRVRSDLDSSGRLREGGFPAPPAFRPAATHSSRRGRRSPSSPAGRPGTGRQAALLDHARAAGWVHVPAGGMLARWLTTRISQRGWPPTGFYAAPAAISELRGRTASSTSLFSFEKSAQSRESKVFIKFLFLSQDLPGK